MRIKLTSNSNGTDYISVKDFSVNGYCPSYDKSGGVSFWYFSSVQFFSYNGYPYKFKTKKDVMALIQDIYYSEVEGKIVIYDLDAKIEEIGLELV